MVKFFCACLMLLMKSFRSNRWDECVRSVWSSGETRVRYLSVRGWAPTVADRRPCARCNRDSTRPFWLPGWSRRPVRAPIAHNNQRPSQARTCRWEYPHSQGRINVLGTLGTGATGSLPKSWIFSSDGSSIAATFHWNNNRLGRIHIHSELNLDLA